VQYQSDFCNFDSQRREDEFRDLMPPPPPLIETASVDPLSGDIQLYWENVPSPDLNFYRVQDIDLVGQQFVNVGLVNVGEPTEFIYETAGLNGSKTLAVIAFDECGNDASYGLTASTMFTEAEYTECSLDAMVSWTPYEGWPEGLASYLIQAFIDGDGPFLMGEADASATFYLAEVEPNRDYCFYVEAQSQGVQRNATSNRACVVTNYPNISSITYLSSVNVIDNNSLEVNILQDQQAEGTSYELFRARQGGSFISLGVFDQTPEQIFTYVDEGIDARSVKYFYKFDAYDGCNTLIGSSNLGTNIVLDGVAETRELKNYLSWNAYQNWEEGVDAYQIWRKLGNQDAFELYAQVDGNTLIFEDDVEQFREEEGQFCYRIVALESPNSFGISSASISFEDCVTQPPIIWIPSAMVINGQPENQIFKPVSGFIDLDSYRMEIYNKWGQLIFESDDVNEGWDGTFKGNEVREDFFRYIIIFKDGSGKPFVEQDVVYVLKK
jgi:gliding motility-associated-like protein